MKNFIEKLTTRIKKENIFEAIAEGDVEKVRNIINKNPKWAEEKEEAFSPTFFACYHKNAEITELLLEAGGDVNEIYDGTIINQGQTMLHFASREGLIDIMQLLIDKGADIDAPARAKQTPLHFAVINKKQNAAELLLSNHANPNSQNSLGFTPIDVAIACESPDLTNVIKLLTVIKLLIRYGVDINAKDHTGQPTIENVKDPELKQELIKYSKDYRKGQFLAFAAGDQTRFSKKTENPSPVTMLNKDVMSEIYRHLVEPKKDPNRGQTL